MECTKKIEIVAHRGANALAPENTMSAIQCCIDLGVEYIELDVKNSIDGVLYNFHDGTLERTTNGKGRFEAQTSKTIDSLDAGIKFDPAFAGEKIPRVDDILAHVKGKMKVFFDFKSDDIDPLLYLARKHELENECFFWFSDNELALEFNKKAPEFQLKMNAKKVDELESLNKEFSPAIIGNQL